MKMSLGPGHRDTRRAYPLAKQPHGDTLPDHPGRLIEDGRRNRNAELLGRLQVDDKVEFRRSLNGQLTWVSTIEDAIDVVCRTPVQSYHTGAIGHECPRLCKQTNFGNHGELVGRRKVYDLASMRNGERVRKGDQRIRVHGGNLAECLGEIVRAAHFHRVEGHA